MFKDIDVKVEPFGFILNPDSIPEYGRHHSYSKDFIISPILASLRSSRVQRILVGD